MNNELERILGEVADGASRQAGAIPVDALHGRGVRRRRTRQAGYSAVGVAAAFGLAFGAAQLLPDDGAPGPAVAPTTAWPTADTSLPLGACGSVVTNLPAIDSTVWLELSSTEVSTPIGAPAPVTVTVQNFDAEPLDLTRGEGPYLFAVRDDVVVGFAWPTTPDEAAVAAGGEHTRDDVGPFVLCEQGELRPSGGTDGRDPLPAGTYTIHTAITLRPEAERAESDLGWAFDLLGRDGTLTITDPGASAERPPTTGWPALDPGAKAGACGSGEAFPVFDTPIPLGMSPRDPSIVAGSEVAVTTSLDITHGTPLVDELGHGPYLIAVREAVVVGYSWLRDPPGPSTLEPGEHRWDGFGPFVLCDPGEEFPTGSTEGRTPLPPGGYAVWVAQSYQAPAGSADWAFENIEHGGTLTVEPADTGTDPGSGELAAVDVTLPACGERIAGLTFPDGVVQKPDTVVTARAAHTDAGGTTYLDGYGDQLDIVVTYGGAPGDHHSVTVIEGGAVVARDGVVVAVMALDQYRGAWVNLDSVDAAFSLDETHDWVDCASGEHTQVPEGEYEMFGWQQLEWQTDGRTTTTQTHGFGPVPLTVYDYGDPDNPGPSTP